MAIRKLRLIEYIYETPEQAAEDQLRWTNNRYVPARGGRGFIMRSVALPSEVVDFPEVVGLNEEVRARLEHHLIPSDDPCQDRGVEWPCDVASALIEIPRTD